MPRLRSVIRSWLAFPFIAASLATPFASAAPTTRPAGVDHWSFAPVVKPPLPAVRDAAWPRDDVDRFILARIEADAR